MPLISADLGLNTLNAAEDPPTPGGGYNLFFNRTYVSTNFRELSRMHHHYEENRDSIRRVARSHRGMHSSRWGTRSSRYGGTAWGAETDGILYVCEH